MAMMEEWRLATLLLLLLQGIRGEGLLEVSLGRFVELKLDNATPTEFLLKNIPGNVSFVLFQIHSQSANMTLSFTKIPERNGSAISSDAGLLNILRPEQTVCTWYVETAYPNPMLTSALATSYTDKDPIPGACNLEFNLDIDPNIYLQYNLYETVIKFALANLGHARNASAVLCDARTDQTTRWRLQYDVYQYFLPENNLNESTLISHLQRMSTPSQISANGKRLATLNEDQTTMSLSSIPGQGIIYNVIVRDPLLKTSAAYVPVHTYACNFTATIDNCHTLGKVSTKIFFTVFAILGLFVCFFGHRFLKTGFFFIGFIIFGFLMFVLLTRVTHLNYNDRLILTAFTAVIGGLLLAGYWWRFGFDYFCISLVGLVLGFLVSSIALFTPLGDIDAFRDETAFWLTFTCIAIAVPISLLPFPRVMNILSCTIVGSYAVVLAIDCYLYTSLGYITLNVLKRALNSEFNRTYTSVPFQTSDFIVIAVWAVLVLAGTVTQFCRERKKPPFPPTPYVIWKRDRERRITNILDPIYHTPPLKERFLASLARFRDLFRKEQPLGERTPLLL